MSVRYYKPRGKRALVDHLEAYHASRVDPRRWTVAALQDLHDGYHAQQIVGADDSDVAAAQRRVEAAQRPSLERLLEEASDAHSR